MGESARLRQAHSLQTAFQTGYLGLATQHYKKPNPCLPAASQTSSCPIDPDVSGEATRSASRLRRSPPGCRRGSCVGGTGKTTA